MTQDEIQLKEKCDTSRRREVALNDLKAKLQQLASGAKADSSSTFLRDIQQDFDRYLRNYVKLSDKLNKNKAKYEVSDEAEMKAFQSRWADFLVNEESDDLRPILGLDSYEAAPRPYRLWNRYEVSSAVNKHKTGFNLMFDREL